MAVSNSIAKRENPKASQVTEYQSNGETVKLSPQIIRRYLVSGGGNVSDEEVMMFLSMCRFQHLNPFLREAYLIKYGDSQPATMVTGKDVFLKRAKRQPEFCGLQAGIIVKNIETGEIDEREGTFYMSDSEALVGGWAKAYIKGYTCPFYSSVPLAEYIGKKKNGEVNGQWSSKPATMIRKVALAQVLKEAFPDENSGLYAQEEIAEVSDIVLESAAVVPEEVQENKVEAVPDAIQQDAAQDPTAALFGEVNNE